MAQDEYYSFDEFYQKNKQEPAEVKRLISEGAIKVYRDANQVKLKAPEIMESRALKSRSRHLSSEESQYYRSSCRVFREENWGIITISVFLAACSISIAGFWEYSNALLPGLSILFLFTAPTVFLTAIYTAASANAFFARFLVLSSGVRRENKSELVWYFNKGYSYRQGARLLCVIGFDSLTLFLTLHLIAKDFILGGLLILVFACIVLACYYYMQNIEKNAAVGKKRKPVLFIEEDAANVFPGILAKEPRKKEEKVEVELDEPREDPLFAKGLKVILKNKSVKVRRDALKTIGKLDNVETLGLLVEALGDEAPEVRAQAITVLARQEEQGIREAIKCLFRDDAAEVRTAAAESFGLWSNNAPVPLLLNGLEDDSPEVRGACAEALGKLHKKKAIKHLVPRVKDSDWFARHKAVIALGKMRSDLSIDAIEHLIVALRDEHEYVSLASEHILKKLAEDMAQDDPLYDEVMAALENVSEKIMLPDEMDENSEAAGEEKEKTVKLPEEEEKSEKEDEKNEEEKNKEDDKKDE